MHVCGKGLAASCQSLHRGREYDRSIFLNSPTAKFNDVFVLFTCLAQSERSHLNKRHRASRNEREATNAPTAIKLILAFFFSLSDDWFVGTRGHWTAS